MKATAGVTPSTVPRSTVPGSGLARRMPRSATSSSMPSTRVTASATAMLSAIQGSAPAAPRAAASGRACTRRVPRASAARWIGPAPSVGPMHEHRAARHRRRRAMRRPGRAWRP